MEDPTERERGRDAGTELVPVGPCPSGHGRSCGDTSMPLGPCVKDGYEAVGAETTYPEYCVQ